MTKNLILAYWKSVNDCLLFSSWKGINWINFKWMHVLKKWAMVGIQVKLRVMVSINNWSVSQLYKLGMHFFLAQSLIMVDNVLVTLTPTMLQTSWCAFLLGIWYLRNSMCDANMISTSIAWDVSLNDNWIRT